MSSYLDTRTLQSRLDELTIQRNQYMRDRMAASLTKAGRARLWEQSEDGQELAALIALKAEVHGWQDGRTLIPEDEFIAFAMDYAEEIGAIRSTSDWPCKSIDWAVAANDLRSDYTEVQYQGTIYLYRS